jgi:hypothetical protein
MTASRKALFVSLGLLCSFAAARAATKPIQTSNAEGQALAAELRSLAPTENLEIKGALKIRDGNGKRTIVPFRYQVVVGNAGWQSIYETQSTGRTPAEKLVVVHADRQRNRYLHSRSAGPAGGVTEPSSLAGDKAMVPFANSDFWLADLGLEFLQWPEQRIVKEAKIKMRKSRPCKVLESINPNPGVQGYTRVRSWIDSENHAVILAEAYGPDGKLIKEFEVGGVAKVNGRYEPRDVEMRDARTDSKTVLEFQYDQKQGE